MTPDIREETKAIVEAVLRSMREHCPAIQHAIDSGRYDDEMTAAVNRITAHGFRIISQTDLTFKDALDTERTLHAAWRKRAEEAEADLHDMRAALSPFAKEADEWEEMGDTRPISGDTKLTVGDLRRAREAWESADTVREKTIEECAKAVEARRPLWEEAIAIAADLRALKTTPADQVVDVNKVMPSAPALSQEREGINLKLLTESITEEYGERCPDFEGSCICCLAWAAHDALANSQRNEVMDDPTPSQSLTR